MNQSTMFSSSFYDEQMCQEKLLPGPCDDAHDADDDDADANVWGTNKRLVKPNQAEING